MTHNDNMALHGDDLVRALIVNRLPALRPLERRMLFDALPVVDDYRTITIARIERIVRRRLRPRSFERDNILRTADHDHHYLRLNGIRVVIAEQTPFLLQQIADPPFVLFARGRLSAAEDMILAVVGTRRPSAAAVQASATIGRQIAEQHMSLVSGLAKGVDRAVMQAAAATGGRVIAVLGNGIDHIYPSQNRRLAHDIMDSGGAIVSEYSPGVEPMKHHFPARNRIISGLSRAVLVIEAPHKSGALITAQYALEQGRDLFVHAVSVDSGNGKGSNALIDDGAAVIRSIDRLRSLWGYVGMDDYLGEPAPVYHAAALCRRSAYGGGQ